MHECRAVIDIGSNTVRLVVYNGPRRAPTVLLNEKVSAKLGKNLGRTGQLSQRAMNVALAGLARFATLLRLMEVEDVQTVATAAARDAENGPAFLEQVRECGLDPQLLSGDEEARFSALGVVGAFPGAKGTVADLGGGSLELVAVNGESCEIGISLPFGSLRLAELRAEGERNFAARLGKALDERGWTGGEGQPLFLVGGSWRAFARYALHLEAQAHASPLDDPHGLELDPTAVLRICRALLRDKPQDEVAGISASRLAGLPNAAALLAGLVERLRPVRLIFSSWGLREGLLFSRLDPLTRASDPLVVGVAEFVGRYGISAATATMVSGWTAPVVAAADHRAERLRLAATMLALASTRTEPNLRTDGALDWALRKRWVGLDNLGRARLAAAMIGNSGRTEVPADVAELAPTKEIREAIGWGLAIRFCRKLSAGAPRALVGTSIAVEAGRLVVTLQEFVAALYTDSAGKDLRLLADWMGLVPDVRLSRTSSAVLPDAA